jgi:hypothetical protein
MSHIKAWVFAFTGRKDMAEVGGVGVGRSYFGQPITTVVYYKSIIYLSYIQGLIRNLT